MLGNNEIRMSNDERRWMGSEQFARGVQTTASWRLRVTIAKSMADSGDLKVSKLFFG